MGKAYRIPSATDRLRKQQRQIKDLQALNRNRNTPRPVASTATAGVSAAGDTGGGTGNFLRTEGDTMTGPLALAPPVDFSIDIDSDGIINIGESSSNSQYTSNIQFEDIQPNTFTLDTIAGAAFNGQILILRTFAPSSPITIAQATLANGGNIQTPNDADFDMGDLQMISLVFDADLIVFDNAPGGTWRVWTGDVPSGDVSSSVATLAMTSTQSAGVIDFDNNVISGTGITDETATTTGVFRLSGAIYQLNSSVTITDNNSTLEAQWQTATDVAFTTPVSVGRTSESTTIGTTSNAPITTVFVDATSADVFVRLNTTDLLLTPTIEIEGTWGQIFSLGGIGGGGGGGISFPIDFPITFLGTITGPIQDIDFSLSTRHGWKAEFGANITLTFSNSPTGELGLATFKFKQDVTGGRTLTLPAGTVNKDIVEAGFLLGSEEETGIVIEFFNDTFYAFLETGNIVSGGIDVSQWATFPAVSDVNFATFDGTNIDRLLFSQTAGSALLSTTTGLTSDATGNLLSNVPSGAIYQQSIGGVLSLNLSIASNITSLQVVGDLGAQLTLSETNGSTVGSILQGTATMQYTTPTDHEFVIGVTAIVDITSAGMDMNSNKIFDLLDPTADQDAATKKYVDDNAAEFFGPWTATHDAGGQLLDNLGNLNTDAANLPASGKFKLGNDELISWVKTDNVSVVSIGLRATDLFSLTGANLSLVGNDIVDTNLLEGRLSNPLNINVPTAGQALHIQFQGTNEWTFEAASLGGDNIILNNTLTINDSSTNPVANGQFSRNGFNLGLEIPQFTLQNTTTIATDVAEFSLLKIDTASSAGDNIAEINFTVFDSPTATQYARILTKIVDQNDAGSIQFDVRADDVSDVNALTIEGSATTTNRTFVSLNSESRIGSDLKFQAPTGSADLKIFPALNTLGISFDNISYTVGTKGSFGTPFATTGVSTNIAALDAAFGDHVGDGGFIEISSTLTEFVKQDNGNWGTVAWVFDAITS